MVIYAICYFLFLVQDVFFCFLSSSPSKLKLTIPVWNFLADKKDQRKRIKTTTIIIYVSKCKMKLEKSFHMDNWSFCNFLSDKVIRSMNPLLPSQPKTQTSGFETHVFFFRTIIILKIMSLLKYKWLLETSYFYWIIHTL